MCPQGDTASIVLIPNFHARFTVHRELRPPTAARSNRPYNAKDDADDPQDAHDLNEPLRRWPVRRRARSTTHRMFTRYDLRDFLTRTWARRCRLGTDLPQLDTPKMQRLPLRLARHSPKRERCKRCLNRTALSR